MPGRGLLTAACLILIALACISAVRKFERERRLLSKLRRRNALDPQSAVPLESLTADERDWAESLAAAGVLGVQDGRCYIRSSELPVYRRKRLRLALSGGLTALILALLVGVLILHR